MIIQFKKMKKPLTTDKIFEVLQKDVYTRSSFIGVFPRNKLPNIQKYPCCFVFNTEPSYKDGEHWLALYFDKNRKCEFFDSYGKHPSEFGLLTFLNKFSCEFDYNNYQLQSFNSASCGYYCIYFLMMRSRQFTLFDSISLFSKSDFNLNDFKVENIID